MEAVGSIEAREETGPQRILSITGSSDAQERIKTEEKARTIETKPQKPQKVDETRIERIAEAMDNYVKSVQRDLNIRVDHDTDKVIVKVLSRDTGEVIREIPPEELLRLASRMEEMAGVLINERA